MSTLSHWSAVSINVVHVLGDGRPRAGFRSEAWIPYKNTNIFPTTVHYDYGKLSQSSLVMVQQGVAADEWRSLRQDSRYDPLIQCVQPWRGSGGGGKVVSPQAPRLVFSATN